MMNIPTQLLQTGNNKTSNSANRQKLGSDVEKKGKVKRFAFLIMGFLGMQTAEKSEGKTVAGSLGNQPENKQSDHQLRGDKNDQQMPAGVWIGSQVLPLNISQNKAIDSVSVDQELQTTKSGESKVSNKLVNPFKLESSMQGTVNQKEEAVSIPNDTVKAPKDVELKNTLEKPKDEKGNLSVDAAKLTLSSSQKVSTVPVKTTTSKADIPKNGPEAKPLVIPQKSMPNTIEDVRRMLEQEIDSKKPDAIKKPQNIKEPANVSRKVPESKNDRGPKLERLTTQPEKTKNTPKRSVKNRVSDRQIFVADTERKQPAAAKPSISSVAAGVHGEAARTTKMAFKPIQQSTPAIELDPSQILNVDGANKGNIELEMQSKGDEDASPKKDGKSPVRLEGSMLTSLNKSSGRRQFSVQMARQLRQTTAEKSPATKRWSHHRFVLDDGKSVNVSVRHADGAMQLQLSAGNSELSKIIHQHIDEIRQHLQKQMNIEINLQLQNFGDQEAGSGRKRAPKKSGPSNAGSNLIGKEIEAAEHTSTRTARYLGFNNNEWTA
ncbi:MAG: hypothetical protein PVH63_10670 [Balneolaceae bacterium]|jgi:hypothetical protein